MKKIFFFVPFLFIVLASCNQDDKEPEFTINGYWNLSLMVPAWQILGIEEEQVDFDEKYIFNHDGTFIKFSNKPKGMGEKLQVPSQALGVYTFDALQGQDDTMLFVLQLSYDTNVNMAANCGEGPKETLFVTKDRKLINNSWSACDGPSYIYTKGK
ncbi:hypothetical protein [Cecembia calidifontis]|nr:hypothetical protein [Cecembia calidifontis]